MQVTKIRDKGYGRVFEVVGKTGLSVTVTENAIGQLWASTLDDEGPRTGVFGDQRWVPVRRADGSVTTLEEVRERLLAANDEQGLVDGIEPECRDCGAADAYDDWELAEGTYLCCDCVSARRESRRVPQEWYG